LRNLRRLRRSPRADSLRWCSSLAASAGESPSILQQRVVNAAGRGERVVRSFDPLTDAWTTRGGSGSSQKPPMPIEAWTGNRVASRPRALVWAWAHGRAAASSPS
jgi:hypothetical protein